jgi:tRNA threonylcarbamoyladenosine biosynthesis protein TsaE
MGYEEYFYSGDLCLIEWPELIEELLPEDAMVVRIEALSPTERRFTID